MIIIIIIIITIIIIIINIISQTKNNWIKIQACQEKHIAFTPLTSSVDAMMARKRKIFSQKTGGQISLLS